MGYTHYWTFKKSPAEIEGGTKRFKAAVALFKEGLKKLQDIPLGDGRGENEPIITDTAICFNGKAPEDGESCYITIESKGFDFCKTARQPYDPAVCLLLLCMADAFGDDFEYSSDGDIENGEEGWARAKEIFAEL
jgi:hypothetical protein